MARRNNRSTIQPIAMESNEEEKKKIIMGDVGRFNIQTTVTTNTSAEQ